jgi:hypothetical protein
MRRIPWLAVAVLAGLLVAALPLASAESLPASTYLQLVPIVGQQPPSLQDLVLRDADLPADRRGYGVVLEGVLTNEAAAARFADPIGALAQFRAQGREGAYELFAERSLSGPLQYFSQVTHYATTSGAAAALDMTIDSPPVNLPPECGAWQEYPLLKLYGEQTRAKERLCLTPNRVSYQILFVAVRYGTYVTMIGIVDVQRASDTTLDAFVTPAVAKLP